MGEKTTGPFSPIKLWLAGLLTPFGAWSVIIAGIVGVLYGVLTGSYVIFFPSAYLLILGFRMRKLIRREKFVGLKVLQSLRLWVMPGVSSAAALFWLFLVLYNLQDLSRMR